MNPSVATVFEWERYPYVVRSRNGFSNGVFSLTQTFLYQLETLDPDGKMFDITRDTIRIQQHVGVIRIEGFALQILPKLFKERYVEHKSVIARNLAVMLSYGAVPFSPVGMAALDKEDVDLLEIFISLFATNLLHLLTHNQSREYLENRDTLRFVQERIVTREYWNPARLHIIPCQFHAFSQDTLINQTLKYCSTLMLRQTRNYQTVSTLKKILLILEPVDYTPVTLYDVRHIQINRLNRKYGPFITFCEFYLSHTCLALQASDTEMFSLLVPMERVFESFIAGIMLEYPHVLPSGITCKSQYHGGYLAEDHRGKGLFRLRLDIVLFQKDPVVVIDTKYKILSWEKRYADVKQPDVYQMYAYGAKTGAGRILLLYPDDGEQIFLNWKMEYDKGRKVDLLIRSVSLSLDLVKEWDLFIGQIIRLLQEVCMVENSFQDEMGTPTRELGTSSEG